jgi:hypothetical protein
VLKEARSGGRDDVASGAMGISCDVLVAMRGGPTIAAAWRKTDRAVSSGALVVRSRRAVRWTASVR